MTALDKGDRAVERAAERLQSTADRFAAEGGAKAKLAEALADDAAFLRRLKPSLVRARMKGESPTDMSPAQGTVRAGMTSFGEQPPSSRSGGGPSPILVVAAAFAVGVVVARMIDWRSHAHPRV